MLSRMPSKAPSDLAVYSFSKCLLNVSYMLFTWLSSGVIKMSKTLASKVDTLMIISIGREEKSFFLSS